MTNNEGLEIMRLVGSYISDYGQRYIMFYDSVEDMHSELTMRVVKAYPNYDSSKGTLSTYVWAVCKGAIKRRIAYMKRAKRSIDVSTVSLQDCIEDEKRLAMENIIGCSIDVEDEVITREDILRYTSILSPIVELHYIYMGIPMRN